MDISIAVTAVGVARSTSYYLPGSGNSFFDANFRNTLNWGGITSVTDAATGELIDDWTVTSASGVNYANPIPEPTAFGLLATGVSVLLVRRRNR